MRPEYDYPESVTQPRAEGPGLDDSNPWQEKWERARALLVTRIGTLEKGAAAIEARHFDGSARRAAIERDRANTLRSFLEAMDRMAGES